MNIALKLFDMWFSLQKLLLKSFDFVPSNRSLSSAASSVQSMRPASWSWFGPGWQCWNGGTGRAWRWAAMSRWDSRVGAKYQCSLCSLFSWLSSWPSGLGYLLLSHRFHTVDRQRSHVAHLYITYNIIIYIILCIYCCMPG